MTLRVVAAGLLVGLLGIAALAGAFGVERQWIKQVGPFLAEHPEMFRVAPNTAILGLLGLTLWLGLLFAFLFYRAFPPEASRPASTRAAIEFG